MDYDDSVKYLKNGPFGPGWYFLDDKYNVWIGPHKTRALAVRALQELIVYRSGKRH